MMLIFGSFCQHHCGRHRRQQCGRHRRRQVQNVHAMHHSLTHCPCCVSIVSEF
jgi:hypothetical protein